MPTFWGAIFDVDGVLVDSPHEKAWRESLRELMESTWSDIRERTNWSPEAFTSVLYQKEVAGKPRISGAVAALNHFGVPEVDVRAQEYADYKQAMVSRLIDAGNFTAYTDALRFIVAVKDMRLRVGAASSSKNANQLLGMIRLDRFAQEQVLSSASVRSGDTLRTILDADVSGRSFPHGKPAPDMFLAAAHELGIAPENLIVLEDSAAGVEAANAGGMAAIGVARKDDDDLLVAAGADIVVQTLDEVDLRALATGRLAKRSESRS